MRRAWRSRVKEPNNSIYSAASLALQVIFSVSQMWNLFSSFTEPFSCIKIESFTKTCFSISTLMAGQQEGHPAYRKSASTLPKSYLLAKLWWSQPNLELIMCPTNTTNSVKSHCEIVSVAFWFELQSTLSFEPQHCPGQGGICQGGWGDMSWSLYFKAWH